MGDIENYLEYYGTMVMSTINHGIFMGSIETYMNLYGNIIGNTVYHLVMIKIAMV